MIRPVFLGCFLRRKPSPRWRTYLVLWPRQGFVSRADSLDRGGLAQYGWVVPGLWYSRPSHALGERVWIRVGKARR